MSNRYAIIVEDRGFSGTFLSGAKALRDNTTIKLPTGCEVIKFIKKTAEPVREYHGWIIVEEGGAEFTDIIHVEWQDEKGRHSFYAENTEWDNGTGNGWRGQSGAARAVEWWDKKLGKAIKLQPMLKDSYRVYTEE